MSRLRLEQLEKHYGAQTVVNCISLDLAEGEFLSLVGPSGCGKTTILRMIAGLIEPDGGRIRIGEQDVTHTPAHQRNLGLVFQSYALFPHMTVFDNIAFGLRRRNVDETAVDSRVRHALDMVRLGHLASRYPKQMSGGQQQRIALARALVIQPSLLLLDEPLSNLDALLRDEMRIEIKRLQRELGISTVFVTHDQAEALSMADRVAVLNRGNIEQVGAPEDLYRRPATAFIAGFIGRSNLFPVKAVSRQGSNAVCEIEGGLFVHARAPAAELARRSVVGVRHEHVRLASVATGEVNSFAGEVVVTSFEGALTKYVVKLDGGAEIQAINPTPAVALKAHERVHAEWRVEEALLLPAEPGPT